MAKTVVGLFNSNSEAEQAKQELINDGYAASQLTVLANDANYTGSTSSTTDSAQNNRTMGEKIEHFFSNLMGGDSDAHEHYASGVNQGGALLAIRTEDADADEIADWLDEHGARKIDRNARSVNTSGSDYRDNLSGTTGASTTGYNTGSVNAAGSGYGDNLRDTTGTAAATGTSAGEYNAEVLAAGRGTGAGSDKSSYNDQSEVSGYSETDTDLNRDRASREGNRESQTIPVVEEELEIGKRTIDRGGVRVYTHVSEQPVDQSVTLRDESINVERRAVDRPATAADFSANQGKTIEMYAQGEEAVVGKKSRVVEEVVVGKEVNERTENVHDNVRKTEVDVEEFDGGDRNEKDRNRDTASYTGAKNTDRL